MKKYLKLVCLIVMLLIIPTLVNASDDTEYTTTSTINGVTANLQYKLDEKNQVIELYLFQIFRQVISDMQNPQIS